jgi:hypothetical protein
MTGTSRRTRIGIAAAAIVLVVAALAAGVMASSPSGSAGAAKVTEPDTTGPRATTGHDR